MLNRSIHHKPTCPAPLSPEAREGEIEQLRKLGLDDDDWPSNDQCPFCAGRPLTADIKDREPKDM